MLLFLEHETDDLVYEFDNYNEYEEIIKNIDVDVFFISYNGLNNADNYPVDECLFDALEINHDNLKQFYEVLELDLDNKLQLIFLGDYIGFLEFKNIDYICDAVVYYEAESYYELAEITHPEEMFPECLGRHMVDIYDLLAEDLKGDYNEYVIDGVSYFYTVDN